MGKKADDGVLPDDFTIDQAVHFVESDAAVYVRTKAQPGAFDVVINDVFDSAGRTPDVMKTFVFYEGGFWKWERAGGEDGAVRAAVPAASAGGRDEGCGPALAGLEVWLIGM